MSCALAYKSHSFSWTLVGFGNDSDHPSYIQGGYYGFLYGESIRAQNLFLSLSTGVAYSSMTLKYPSQNSLNGLDMTRFDRQGYSFPIELKLFLLARNGIGLGIHLSKNIISPLNFSPFCWGVSIVFGVWNKPRVK
jgi:hypothetical protein